MVWAATKKRNNIKQNKMAMVLGLQPRRRKTLGKNWVQTITKPCICTTINLLGNIVNKCTWGLGGMSWKLVQMRKKKNIVKTKLEPLPWVPIQTFHLEIEYYQTLLEQGT